MDNNMDDERFIKIEQKLDLIVDKQSEMTTHLAVYNEQLKVHIKGTEDNRADIKQLQIDLEPVKDHVKLVRSLAKIAAALGTIGSALFAGIKLFFKL